MRAWGRSGWMRRDRCGCRACADDESHVGWRHNNIDN
jgi:hypothetical protein